MKMEGGHSKFNCNKNDQFDGFNFRAFPIPCPVEGEDLSTPPLDGFQYLRRVMEEKKKCEGVISVKMDLPAQSNLPTIHVPTKKECNQSMLPSKNYQLYVIASFSKLRLQMESYRKKIESDSTYNTIKKSLPSLDDDGSWLKICLQESPDLFKNCARGPSTRLCLAVSESKISRLLSYFPDWIMEGSLGVADSCRWVYCLLACLELPVDPGVYYILRQIARTLLELRANLENEQCDSLLHMNLIIIIISRYFGQEDLADAYI